MNVSQILAIAISIAGIVIFLLLILIKGINPAVRFVSSFLILSFIIYIIFGLQTFRLPSLFDILSGFFLKPVFLIIPPLYYLIIRWLLLPDYEWTRSDFKLILPLIIVLIINTLVLSYFSIANIGIFSEKEEIISASNFKSFSVIINSLMGILYIIQLVFYSLTTTFLAIKKKHSRNFDKEIKRISFRKYLWIYIMTFIFFALLSTMNYLWDEMIILKQLTLGITLCIMIFTGLIVIKTSLTYEKH